MKSNATVIRQHAVVFCPVIATNCSSLSIVHSGHGRSWVIKTIFFFIYPISVHPSLSPTINSHAASPISLSYLQMTRECQILEGLFPHQCRRSLLTTNIVLVAIFFKLNRWLRDQSMVYLCKTRCLLHQVSSSSLIYYIDGLTIARLFISA